MSVDEKKETKEEREKIQRIELMLTVFERGTARHTRSKDPILRTTLLVDKLCTIVDVGIAALMIDYPDIPNNLKDRMKNSANLINDELNFLLDWISSPQYDPDHIYGKAFVEGATNKHTNK